MIDCLPITQADLPACGAVLDAAFNGMGTGARLAHYLHLQPENWFMARREDVPVATVGAFNYGAMAAIGLMAVHPDYQRQGIGQILLKHLLAKLDADGCPISFLDATQAGEPMYEKLGFRAEGRGFRFDLADHTPHYEALPAGIRTMTEADLSAVIAFDAPRFGAGRAVVIQSFFEGHPRCGFVAVDLDGQVQGYLIAQHQVIGPWVAATPQIAESLLHAALSLSYDAASPRVIFPGANTEAVTLLTRYGFTQQRNITHMRRGGDRDPRMVSALYGQASFMLG